MSIVTLQVQNTSIKHSPHMPVTSVLCVAPSARSSTKHRKKLKCSTEQRNFSDDRRAKKNTRMGFKQKKKCFFPSILFYDSHAIRNRNERSWEREKKKTRNFCLFSRHKIQHFAYMPRTNRKQSKPKKKIDPNIVINKTTKFFWVHRNQSISPSHMQREHLGLYLFFGR